MISCALESSVNSLDDTMRMVDPLCAIVICFVKDPAFTVTVAVLGAEVSFFPMVTSTLVVPAVPAKGDNVTQFWELEDSQEVFDLMLKNFVSPLLEIESCSVDRISSGEGSGLSVEQE